MADQMRGDCLGIAGHPDVKTPFLDSLAAEGVRYPNAYSACPTCVPARATLYTGMGQKKLVVSVMRIWFPGTMNIRLRVN